MIEPSVRVLLVEDSEQDYQLVRALFAALPPGAYHLDRVSDYPSALKALDDCHHDLYLIDYRLDGHTGLGLIREATRRGCSAPFIVLTDLGARDTDLLSMEAGAADYLVKDQLDAAKLERVMRYALQHKRLQEEIRQANAELEDRVRSRTAELARVNADLQSEVAERERVAEALRQADRRKDEFLATLAHELRNPLAPLVSSLQLLQLDSADPKQVAWLTGIMDRHIAQLVRLIDDLLDVSRISRGKVQLRCESVSLEEVLDTAIEISRPALEAEQHVLSVSNSSPGLTLHGDRVRLVQIVGNLLSNAAKYTPRGGRIELAAGESRGQVEIVVTDNGIGIPPTMLPRVFEMFTQIDQPLTGPQRGLGVGLTLARTLVEMHGGQIEAASEGPGRGSRFTVRLPLGNVLQKSPPRATSLPTGLPVYRILIVDDNEPAAFLLSRLLQKLGQQTQAVNAATEALQLLPQFQPEIIFSDIAMPGMDGYELARQLRAANLAPRPLLIALTGYGQESDRTEAAAAGFDRHLTKPVGVPMLEQLLRSVARPS